MVSEVTALPTEPQPLPIGCVVSVAQLADQLISKAKDHSSSPGIRRIPHHVLFNVNLNVKKFNKLTYKLCLLLPPKFNLCGIKFQCTIITVSFDDSFLSQICQRRLPTSSQPCCQKGFFLPHIKVLQKC